MKYNKVGVIGAGSFGTVVANIVASKVEQVLVYARSDYRLHNFNEKRENNTYAIKENILATKDIQKIAEECQVLLALVPSSSFREMIRSFSPYLKPDHIIIHGTKGVDIDLPFDDIDEIHRHQIHTMSEVIQQETAVRRIGCIAGPNLSKEIAQDQPAGAIVASEFEEVIDIGMDLLNTERFKIFHSNDLLGAEFSGVLKNIFAIASGMLAGLGFGNNARALLITRGLHEMLYLGNSMGGETSAFLGIAGVGDLVATCSSPLSRNYSVGKRLAEGENLQHIVESVNEVAEGVRSIKIFHHYAKSEGITVAITSMLYRVIFEGKDPLEGLKELMSFSYTTDVNFL